MPDASKDSPRIGPRTWIVTIALAAVVALAWWRPFGLLDTVPDESPVPALRYDTEYPAVGYSGTAGRNRVTRLIERIGAGDADLEYGSGRGFLDAVLEALEIDPSSQLLVFSKTSLQVRGIGPERPRAIFFNDDTYAAWIPGARNIEIATMDPGLGPVFYELEQDVESAPELERHNGRCLRCHDSLSLSGGGVPRFILSSGYTGADGQLISHEGHIITNPATPLRIRWGGWYVSGYHGEQVHLGNIVVRDPADLQNLQSIRIGNQPSLDGLLDTTLYPTPYSDIVALLVVEHQVGVQNAVARALFDTLTALADGTASEPRIAAIAEPLVRALFMADMAELGDVVEGTSGFAERFEALGTRDAEGRSLRELDLETRVFRYPLSYLIHSEAINALPEPTKTQTFRRVREVLDGRDDDGAFAHLTDDDRNAIREILSDTQPAILAAR